MYISKMKTLFILFLLMISAGAWTVSAAELLVTVKGQSVRMKESKKDGKNLVYIDETDGVERVVPQTDVAAVIPIMDKNKTYSPEEVDAVLKVIEATILKYVSMTKNLNIIRDEWATLLTVDPIFERRIDFEVQEFMSQPTSSRVYGKVMMNLEMLKFKDKRGLYTGKIDKAVSGIKKTYIGVSLEEFAARANAEKISIEELRDLMDSARKIMDKGSKEDQLLAKTGLDKARTRVLTELTPYARNMFKRYNNLGTYLKGKTVLMMLRDIAGTAEEKAAVQKESDEVSRMVKEALKSVDFSYREFPLYQADLKHLEAARAYSSSNTLEYVKVEDEWAYVIPHAAPVCTGMQGTLTMMFTVVFNRTPVYPMEYCLMVAGIRYNKLFKAYIPLNLAIVNGHADIPLKINLAKTCEDVFPFTSNGGKYLYLYIAARKYVKDRVDDKGLDWIPISRASMIPIATPEE